MQKITARLKNSPIRASQAGCSESLPLNSLETNSVASIVRTVINPEVNYTDKRVALKAFAFVLSIDGERLMPCSLSKCRKLLKSGKARIVRRYPLTIQLTFICENQVQEVALGIDTGYGNIGFSAISNSKELVSGTVVLDGRTSERLNERAMYRRGRRGKLWHRKPRFNNRAKKDGWLPPSIQRRYDTHLKIITLLTAILPVTSITLEIANFDIQKIESTEIEGIGYQNGDMKGYQNMRSYLFARENGRCQVCGKEFEKGTPSHIHHIVEKSNGGTDRVKNLSILHKKCHIQLHKKGIKLKPNKIYKSNTFMSIVQKKFWNDIPNLKVTFGSDTFIKRNELTLKKTHYTDAFVIAGGERQVRCNTIQIKQKHKNNRVLQLNRMGYVPSIRRRRYSIQPKDLVWINGKKEIVIGMQNKGAYVGIENPKRVLPIKSVQKVYNFGTFSFN
jgi:hypothetical protein